MADEKIGLVLAGGGAKGSYQAEVACRIMKEVEIDVISGVSVGALNGSILIEKNFDKLRSIWASSRRSDIWSAGPFRTVQIAFGWALGYYDPSPLIETLKSNFHPNDAQILLKAGAVKLETGEFVDFEINPDRRYTEREVRKARKFVAASSAVPVAVSPVEVGGQKMIDGGTRNIAPVRSAVDEDCDRIIAIFNSRIDNKNSRQTEKPDDIFGVGKWTMDILLNETIRSDVRMTKAVNEFIESTSISESEIKYDKVPIDVIQPSKPLGDATDFSRSQWARRTQIGTRDAKTFLKNASIT